MDRYLECYGVGAMIELARDAIRAWPKHSLATPAQVRALRRGYIRARLILGDRYLLSRANYVQRRPA